MPGYARNRGEIGWKKTSKKHSGRPDTYLNLLNYDNIQMPTSMN